MQLQGIENPTYTSTKSGHVFVCSASGIVAAKVDTIIEAHTRRDKAECFRDIGRYTHFTQDPDGLVRVAFPANIGLFKFPQMFHKRIVKKADGCGRIEFSTPPGGVANVSGAWDLLPINATQTMVNFSQRAIVPGWARFLPVEKYIQSRVTRMMEDLAALPKT